MVNIFGSSKPGQLAGLEISTSSVKLVELSGSGGAYRVERFAVEVMPRGAVVDGNIADIEAVGGAIHRMARRVGCSRNVAVALPSSQVITKRILLSANLREFEMEAQAEAEAGQIIPFSLDEVNLDFQVLGPSAASSQDVDVLIAAARKDKVQNVVDAVEAGGLKAVIVDSESFAMEAAFDLVGRKLFGRDKGWISALVDIGASGTKVTFLQNGKQIYFREQQIGGNQLTHEIVNHYGLSQDEAEADKVSGQLPDGYDQDVLKPFCDLLAMEVSRAMQFFFTSTNYDEVDRIVVSGGCAQLPGLIDAIRARTEKDDGSQVETVVANPFTSMSLASGVRFNNLLAAAPSLMVACGLALRRFDA